MNKMEKIFYVNRNGKASLELEELLFATKLIARNDKGYDEATSFIGNLALKSKYSNGFRYYILDEKEREIIRTNQSKRTIELTDNVKDDTTESIKHIITTEIRAPDFQ